MSDRGGLFGGDGKLLQNYSYGEPSWYPMDYTPDFQVVFPIANPQEILFVTGELTCEQQSFMYFVEVGY